MSQNPADRDDTAPEVVGYRKPPKSGQFKKGQSGNPKGRPRKNKPQPLPELIAARHPTREILRHEAARVIAINDASGRQEMPTRQAVVRALLVKAMQGGVLAQRTALEYLQREDERYHRERKEAFEFWRKYKADAQAEIERAERCGESSPELLPHPDDVALNYSRLEVRFLGAMDEDERAAEKRLMACRDLCFEMSLYTKEDNALPDGKAEEGRLGGYMALLLAIQLGLSPRLRKMDLDEWAIASRMHTGRKEWEEELEQRCQELGVPFIRWNPKDKAPTLSLAQLGIGRNRTTGDLAWGMPRKRAGARG